MTMSTILPSAAILQTPYALARGLVAVDTETTLSTRAEYVPRLVVSSMVNLQGAALVHAAASYAERSAETVLSEHSTWANGPFDWAVYAKRFSRLMPIVFHGLQEGRYHDVLTREKMLDIASGRYKFVRGKGMGRGYSLQMTFYRRTRLYLDKDEGTRLHYGDLADVPVPAWPEKARAYAKSDAAATMHLHLDQDARNEAYGEVHEQDVMLWEDDGSHHVGLRRPDVFEDEHRQLRAKWCLHLATAHGIFVDQEQTAAFAVKVEDEYDRIAARLFKHGLVRREKHNLVRCTKIAKARMERSCALMGIELLLTPQEEIALSEEACERSGDDMLIDYARLTSLQKLKGTYLKVLRGASAMRYSDVKHLPPAQWPQGPVLGDGVDIDPGDPPDPEGRYHAAFDELVDTGRTSCRGILQVLPRSSTAKGMRECFAAPPGKKLVAADFGKAELVAWAQMHMAFFGRSALGEALKKGIDPHVVLGAQILGCSYDEALALKKSGDEWANTVREAAKPANFGFPVGMGAETYVGYAKNNYGVALPGLRMIDGVLVQIPAAEATIAEQVEFAKMVKTSWRSSWKPEADEYLSRIGSMIPTLKDPEGKPVRDSQGRLVRGRGVMTCYLSNRIRGGVSFTECANGYFQALTSDAAKHALWRVTWHQYMEPSSALYGTKVVNFVHDEVIVECNADRAKAVANEMEHIMIGAYREWCRDVPVACEARIGQRWTK